MNPSKHSLTVLAQLFKLIPRKVASSVMCKLFWLLGAIPHGSCKECSPC